MTPKYTIKENAAGWNVYAEGGELISNHHGRREAENAVRRYRKADKRRQAVECDDTDPENIYGLASIRQSIEEDRR